MDVIGKGWSWRRSRWWMDGRGALVAGHMWYGGETLGMNSRSGGVEALARAMQLVRSVQSAVVWWLDRWKRQQLGPARACQKAMRAGVWT